MPPFFVLVMVATDIVAIRFYCLTFSPKCLLYEQK